MFTRKLTAIALISLGFAGSAMAQEATLQPSTSMAHSTARSAVLADLSAARSDGTLGAAWTLGYIEAPMSVRSRMDVLAEAERARVEGELAAINAEAQAVAHTAPHASMKVSSMR